MKLENLTKLQKRYLSQRVCMLCEQPLDSDWCGGIWDKCTPEVREKRRADCLKHYKPRPMDFDQYPETGKPIDEQSINTPTKWCKCGSTTSGQCPFCGQLPQ